MPQSSASIRRDHLPVFRHVQTCACLLKFRRKHHKNNANSGAKSPYPSGWNAPIWTPPIDPFPQYRKLRRGQSHNSILGARPRETAPFEHFVIEAKALPITEQKLDPITPTASKRKHRSTGRLLSQHVLGQRRQPCDPLAHIRDPTVQIHTHTGAQAEHVASTTRINADSAAGSIALSKCKLRLPCRRNSTATEGGASATGACVTGRSSGKKSAPASGNHKPFFFSSCRHA